jgi:hypothetical protein
MAVPVGVPVQKVDFRHFHDEVIQRGDIRIFRTPTNNEVFNMALEIYF